jgi:hypothetical protein
MTDYEHLKQVMLGQDQTIVDRLRIRAMIRRNAEGRKSVLEGKPDRLADLLEEAADVIETLVLNTRKE